MDFLAKDYDFAGPEIHEIDHLGMDVFYSKGDIAVECSLDVRDEMISFRIIHPKGGKRPDVWRVNEAGKVVAEYLTALLTYRGIRDLKFEDPPDGTGLSKRRASFRKQLLGEARLLKKYGQDILFEGYDGPGDRF